MGLRGERESGCENKNNDMTKQMKEHTLCWRLVIKCWRDNKLKGKKIAKKYRPYYYQEIYMIVEDLKNGSYQIQELKWEKNSEIQNVQNLKKLYVWYKITLHPELNKISIVNSEPAPKEIIENNASYAFEVKEILKHKYSNGELYYQVHFKHYWKADVEWIHVSQIDATE